MARIKIIGAKLLLFELKTDFSKKRYWML